jgi:hypothetical protein
MENEPQRSLKGTFQIRIGPSPPSSSTSSSSSKSNDEAENVLITIGPEPRPFENLRAANLDDITNLILVRLGKT